MQKDQNFGNWPKRLVDALKIGIGKLLGIVSFVVLCVLSGLCYVILNLLLCIFLFFFIVDVGDGGDGEEDDEFDDDEEEEERSPSKSSRKRRDSATSSSQQHRTSIGTTGSDLQRGDDDNEEEEEEEEDEDMEEAEFDGGDAVGAAGSATNAGELLDARAKFAGHLLLLNGREMGHVVSTIERECPAALEQSHAISEKLEIVVDALDNKLLDRLEAYASERVKAHGKRPAPPSLYAFNTFLPAGTPRKVLPINDISNKRKRKK